MGGSRARGIWGVGPGDLGGGPRGWVGSQARGIEGVGPGAE